MSRFLPEPSFQHGQAPVTAVLYCNLGTPDAPKAPEVRRFLAEFLGDPRVVEIPRLIWLMILHGVILRVRPAKSAAKYASIWMPEGSPLKYWTDKLTATLQTKLSLSGHQVQVRSAMRYGSNSIASQLDALKVAGATRVLILPAYPQYSATTTASVFDAVYTWAAATRNIPEFRFVNHYHDDPRYIAALAGKVQAYWQTNGRPDELVMSFHGVPERTLLLGDPYHCECFKTARLLAEHLGLAKNQYRVTFQSRLGRAKWLQPYTEPTLIEMGKAGVTRVDLICPAFVSDCLETLEEINQEAREAFLHAGGKEFHYIACLNDDAAWVTALGDIAQQHLQGWPTLSASDTTALQISREQALALGAKQ
ncbi:MAG: ferrochelatase [Rhodoferax sp.]|nr:ferrochelatase [Rhodoferax sp.]